MHTTCSDGTLSPQEQYDQIRSTNLEVFSITDHDTMAAYPLPQDLQSRCIPGMEVDSELNGKTTHILVYGLDPRGNDLLNILEQQRANRVVRLHEMLDRLRECGVNLTLEQVQAHAKDARSFGRPHVARALLSAGYVESVQDAFDRYLAEGQPGYIALNRLSAAQVISMARDGGGVSSVAHPSRLRAESDLNDLHAQGVDGVEVYHPSADAALNEKLLAFAQNHNLLITGGSDFHAPGAGGLGISLNKEHIERLREAIEARNGLVSASVR